MTGSWSRGTGTAADRSRRSVHAAAARERGFTLIELMIVMALIVILASIGLAIYTNSVTRAKESVLKEDLFRMRDAIDQYYSDKAKYPATLQDLVLGEVPAVDSGGSVHELGRYVARGSRGTGPHESDRPAGRVRCQKRVGAEGAGRNQLFGLGLMKRTAHVSALAIVVAVLSAACDKVPLLAPTGSAITL